MVPALAAETVLHTFAPPPKGFSPAAGVIRDSAGNLYGTTVYGGTTGNGVVYKVDATGHETVLYRFCSLQNCADGSHPYTGVIRDSAGNLYGTTYDGVVYEVDTTGHETVLGRVGAEPGPVIRDSAGNLYGTVYSGSGVVYKLDTTGHETVLYSFCSLQRCADGSGPIGGVIRDSAGNLYGTASGGGSANAGVVYKLDTTGHQTVLYSFTGEADGGDPEARVIRDSAGNLYGTTYHGGNLSACTGLGCGVVYKVDATGHETVLYSFTGEADGGNPEAGVIRDSAGNLYGTASNFGSTYGGVVYRLDATGHESVLYSFCSLQYCADGGYSQAGVIRDSAGNLYGTTYFYGSGNGGVVYKVDAARHETVLYSFAGHDGADPFGDVIRDPAGNLYGTTLYGGSGNAGVVYKLDTTSHETVLHSFSGADGGNPVAGVIRDSAGNLYGTTLDDGSAGRGVVYKLDTAGHETVLYNFTGKADGGTPEAGVIRDSAGNLYGTTFQGGNLSACSGLGCGVVYKVDAAGDETVLYTFCSLTQCADGSAPLAGVIRDQAGNLYGTTANGGGNQNDCFGGCGVVYKVDAAGHETVLYSFCSLQQYCADGELPFAGVIRDSAGNLYGTASGGGSEGPGVVYKLDTAGYETVLYNFCSLQYCVDGREPYTGVVRDSAGNLYGTTFEGGNSGFGVVYKLDATGHETVLYSFTGGADGSYPQAGVIRDSAGKLYGTASVGGTRLVGVVFRIP